MKKMLCSVIIAASALNAVAAYAGDEVIYDGVHDRPPVTASYELENTEGLSVMMEEREKTQTLTRDMLMEELYKLDGQPDTNVSKTIGVPYFNSDSETAATWAYNNKIMYGYGGNQFGSGDYATREQLAAMLFRYAADGMVPNLALTFEDSDEISDWAADSVRWAVSLGLMGGDENNDFDPLGAATVYDMNNALRLLGLK